MLFLLGPVLAATGIEQGRRGLGQLLCTLLDWKVGWGWWAFVFAYPIFYHLAVVGMRWAIRGKEDQSELAGECWSVSCFCWQAGHKPLSSSK